MVFIQLKITRFRNFLKHSGFTKQRQKGSHLIFYRNDLHRPFIVAVH
ncbi:MAG: type II toxin-antitoxin system HicA family toxin [Endomicrobium sp.]|nr:type II toxin-antitoxin system HicA family toxin [Endomicrobium sp.]